MTYRRPFGLPLRYIVALFCASLVVALSACSTTDGPDKTLGWAPEKLYAEAKDEMRSGSWAPALKLLEKLESRYPFGRWAQQAQIDIAYVHYKEGERVLALAAVDRFIKLHPNHANMDYVFYLRGLINFNEQQGLIANLGGQDLSERDLRAAREAFDSYKELITRWPESKYAADSAERMRYLINSMANGEMHIARYYYRRGAYLAAANRAQNVVRQYRESAVVEDALFVMWQSYDKLGLDDLKDDAARVFKLNFPNSALPSAGLASADKSWWRIWR